LSLMDIKANFLIKNYFYIKKGSQGTDDCPLCSKPLKIERKQ
jgi:hypothetical protein